MSSFLLNTFNHGLELSHSLINGQCFHWIEIRNKLWLGVVDKYVFELQEYNMIISEENKEENEKDKNENNSINNSNGSSLSSNSILCRVLNKDIINIEEAKYTLQRYLNLEKDSLNLFEYEPKWSQTDPNYMAKALKTCSGVRLFRQDPFECLISFLCSSNNNIPRITLMLKRFRKQYGTKIPLKISLTLPLSSFNSQNENIESEIELEFYQFPTLNQLLSSSEFNEISLKKLGFGYRASYIVKTVQQLQELGGEKWLQQLQNKESFTSSQVVEKLEHFRGVGPKVAACVGLCSLDRWDLVPMDVHMKEITSRYYGSLIKFQSLFSSYSGWVQSILFTAKVFGNKNKKSKIIKEKQQKQQKQQQKRKRKITKSDENKDRKLIKINDNNENKD